MTYTATITSKGQITIPRLVRQLLNTSTVEIEVKGEEVILRPVQSVAGSLARYAQGGDDFSRIRDKVWQEVADEKAGRTA
jgi:AbrB family looped-hinge helix DNA binding protein